MMLLWLLGGIILVTGAFLLPGEHLELWPSLNAGGAAAALYLVALVAYSMRSPFSLKTRIFTWVAFLLIGGAIAKWWTGMDATTHWQRSQLMKIRTTIGRGILLASMPDTLLRTLRVYHEQGPKKKETLGQVFSRLHPGITAGIHFPSQHEWDQKLIYLANISNDEVTLVGEEMFIKGRDPNFRNFDGKTGKIQERATLTEKGVLYESEN